MMMMSRLTRDRASEPVSRDQGQIHIIFTSSPDHERDRAPEPVPRDQGQINIIFTSSADHEQD